MDTSKFIEIFGQSDVLEESIIVKSNVDEAVRIVKEHFKFDILKEITAVDKGESGIELNYRLYSTPNEEDFTITTLVKDEAPSVSKIFDSAVADEKEIYDMFGVRFIGNDELKRLYMPEGFEGNPLKKDFVSGEGIK